MEGLNISSESSIIKSVIRSRYRDLVDAFIEENQYLPEYRNTYDPSKVDVIKLLCEGNRYGLFEIRSDYPHFNFSNKQGVDNPVSFYTGNFCYSYFHKVEEHHRRSVVKKKYKSFHDSTNEHG